MDWPCVILLCAGAAAGAAFGSFACLVAYRLPIMAARGKPPRIASPYNLWVPPSYCPQCEMRLRAWHNIPIASYLVLRGRCARCRSQIPPKYLFVEVVGAAVGLALMAAAIAYVG